MTSWTCPGGWVTPLFLVTFLSLTCLITCGGSSPGVHGDGKLQQQQQQQQLQHHSQHHTVRRSAAAAAVSNSNHHTGNSANNHLALSSLLRRRRSMKGAGLWGPPAFSPYFGDGAGSSETGAGQPAPAKRNQDEAWIWMPAYGYVPMPTDDGSAKDHERAGDRIGNLLRYG